MKELIIASIIIVLLGGCAYFDEGTNLQYGPENKPCDQVWEDLPNNNLRLTLVMDSGTWDYKAVKTAFKHIGEVSSRTDFSPHLIVKVKETIKSTQVGDFIDVSADLYYGNGKFIKTYEAEGWLFYINISRVRHMYVIPFESIARQILADKSLVKYFNQGFDESLSSSNPNIPQIPQLHVEYQRKIKEEQRKAEEEQRKAQVKMNRDLAIKLDQAIQQERWEDAKNIQALIQSMTQIEPVVKQTKPAVVETVRTTQKRSTSSECKRAKWEYNEAVNAYNVAKGTRDMHNTESAMAGIGALNNSPAGLLMGLFANTTQNSANNAQNDMDHALRVMQDAKRRVTNLCTD